MKIKDTQFETYIEKEECVLALYKLEQLRQRGWDININYSPKNYWITGRRSSYSTSIISSMSNSDLSVALKDFLEKVKKSL